jgi:hypothetical protein
MKVLSTGEGGRADSGHVGALAGLEAALAMVPFGEGFEGVLKIIVLVEIVLEGGGCSGDNVEGVNLLIVQAPEIEGGDIVTM